MNLESNENVFNPYKLSSEKVKAIVEEVNDDRLRNPEGDYFILELEDKETHIPKQEKIGVKQESGRIKPTKTSEYITDLLKKADQSSSE